MVLILTLFACKPEPEVEPPVDLCVDAGTICTVSGTGNAGSDEHATVALESPLYAPIDVTAWEEPDAFFIADWNNHKIRLVEGDSVRTIVGTEFLGDGDPSFSERIAPGVPGTDVALNHPTSAEWNPVTGKLLLPSWHNHRVREWSPDTGLSLVVASDTGTTDGNGANAGFAGDGGPAADALMAFPNSIAIDPEDGSFWILPQGNRRIRWIAHDYSLINTVAGDGNPGYTGDGGDALLAQFFFWDPTDLQPEPAGAVEFHAESRMLYIADTANHAIRVLDVAAGTITTLAGTGTQAMPGGECHQDALCYPRDIEIDGDTLYIADTGNHVIRSFDLVSGTMDVVAGSFQKGEAEDGVLATEALFDTPFGIDIASDGALLVADTYNHVIRRVTP